MSILVFHQFKFSAMQHTLLAVSWAVAFLPTPRLKAVVCCTGSKGEAAFQRTLQCGYPERNVIHITGTKTILENEQRTTGICRIVLCGGDPADVFGSCTPPLEYGLPFDEPHVKLCLTVSGNVWFLENGFFSFNSSLISLVCNLPLLEDIADHFVSTCPNLKHIDLSASGRINSIQGNFLLEAGLERICLSTPLPHLTTVPKNFLFCCKSLTHAEITGLLAVTFIEDAFMADCTHLEALDLTPFSNVTDIGNHFLSGCASLTALDMSPMTRLVEVDSCCLQNCVGLTQVVLPSLPETPAMFLEGCTGLASLDLSPLCNTTVVRQGFLKGCTRLVSLDLVPLANATSIEGSFLEDCAAIATLSLDPLRKVRSIGFNFLKGCASLTTLDLTPFAVGSLQQWDRDGLLQGCNFREPVDTSVLPKCFFPGIKNYRGMKNAPLFHHVRTRNYTK